MMINENEPIAEENKDKKDQEAIEWLWLYLLYYDLFDKTDKNHWLNLLLKLILFHLLSY